MDRGMHREVGSRIRGCPERGFTDCGIPWEWVQGSRDALVVSLRITVCPGGGFTDKEMP